jgi:DNA-binding CsgD family transcriptional regulator
MRAKISKLDYGFSISPETWREIAYAIGLSQREVEVLQCLVADQHDNEIAETLGLSQHTVRTYLKRLRAKLGVTSRVRMAERVFAEFEACVAKDGPP